jgi:serine/threonine protein kinase
VFDFGLCKSLSSELKARDGGYGYRLTGRAGSLPYMAVEVSRRADPFDRRSSLSRSLTIVRRGLLFR